jgi:hypothetical protein
MTEHVPLELLQRFRTGGGLSPDEVVSVATHLAGCRECAERGRQIVDATASARAVRAQLEENVTSLPSPRRVYYAAAAVIAIAICGAAFWLRDREPVPSSPPQQLRRSGAGPVSPRATTYGNADWDALVRDARSGAPLQMPAVLRAVRAQSETLRGSGGRATNVSPANVVLETRRPRFSWPSTAPDAIATVVVFAGEEEALRSEPLRASAWTPKRELSAGVTYTWEVQVETSSGLQILPAPPAPPARFHVVSAETQAELDRARDTNDPLLIGLVLSRAGLVEEAREALSRVTVPADLAVAQRVLAELDRWRS